MWLACAGSALQSTSSGTFISDWLGLNKYCIVPVVWFIFSFVSIFYWEKKENLDKIKNWLDSFSR